MSNKITAPLLTATFLAMSWLGTPDIVHAQGKPVVQSKKVAAPEYDRTKTYSAQKLKVMDTYKEAIKFADANNGKNGIAILILKGTESEGGLTGERIGELLVGRFQNTFGVPSKAFVAQSSGKYTAVEYIVHNTGYGPFDMKAAATGQPIIADEYKAATYEKPAADKPTPKN